MKVKPCYCGCNKFYDERAAEKHLATRQLAALNDSIDHWARNCVAAENGKPIPIGNCACCDAFSEHDCRDCPIREAVDQAGCRGTPYWTESYNTLASLEYLFLLNVREFIITKLEVPR
jgi:hypothetical protein